MMENIAAEDSSKPDVATHIPHGYVYLINSTGRYTAIQVTSKLGAELDKGPSEDMARPLGSNSSSNNPPHSSSNSTKKSGKRQEQSGQSPLN